MARLRHFAVCVKDLDKAAEFYARVFDLKRVGREDLEIGSAIYMTDGVINQQIHADMVFFETQSGGAVFSTGSIAYAGSFGHRNFDNPIARLTWNVLRRFVDPTAFPPPLAGGG